jgi:hypothetical protein
MKSRTSFQVFKFALAILFSAPMTVQAWVAPNYVNLSNDPNNSEVGTVISNRSLVWYETSTFQLHHYDLKTGNEFTIPAIPSGNYLNMAVDGNLLVYRRLDPGNTIVGIYGCLFDHVNLTCNEFPIVRNDHSAWIATVKGNRFAYLTTDSITRKHKIITCEYDAVTDSCINYRTVVQDLDHAVNDIAIMDDHNTLIWVEIVFGSGLSRAIRGIRLNQNPAQPFIIESGNYLETGFYYWLTTSGRRITWEDRLINGLSRVKTCDYNSVTHICQNSRVIVDSTMIPAAHLTANMSGDRIVFDDWKSPAGPNDSFLYDFRTNATGRLTRLDAIDEQIPKISGPNIIAIMQRPGITQFDVIRFNPQDLLGTRVFGFSSANAADNCLSSAYIDVNKIPRQGDLSFEIKAFGAPPQASGLLFISTQKTQIENIVTWYVDPSTILSTIPVTSDEFGTASVPLPLSNQRPGTKVFAQFLWNTIPGCGGAGTVAASNALELTVQP